MASWWNVTFFVTGDYTKLDESHKTLPLHFHTCTLERYGANFVKACRNYGGAAAVEAAIQEHPDLIFNGVLSREPEEGPGDTVWTFLGRHGETEWTKHTLPESDGEEPDYWEATNTPSPEDEELAAEHERYLDALAVE